MIPRSRRTRSDQRRRSEGKRLRSAMASPRPGSDLIPDLMNGVVFDRGTSYDISPLDLAILADAGVDVTA